MFCCSKGCSLRNAAWHGNLEKVDQLLDTGADVESRGVNEMTALHRAAAGGHFQVCKLLVEKGKADIGALTVQGLTPLHFASATGHTNKLLEFTMNYGSKPQQSFDAASNKKNCEAIVRLLLEQGADVNAGSTCNHWTVSNKSAGMTPLHVACLMGHSTATVRALINAGADVDAATAFGDNPFHFALAYNAACPVEICQVLLEYDVNIEAKNQAGLSAPAWARKLGGKRAAVCAQVIAGTPN